MKPVIVIVSWMFWGGCGNVTEIDDELDDLHDGDVLLPPDANAAGGLEVVPVHDNVNHQVESDGNPGDRGMSDKLSVAKKGRCTMVIGVKESCLRCQ
jgi:hypothetical protein